VDGLIDERELTNFKLTPFTGKATQSNMNSPMKCIAIQIETVENLVYGNLLKINNRNPEVCSVSNIISSERYILTLRSAEIRTLYSLVISQSKETHCHSPASVATEILCC
jgi:hypothetical protein